MLPINDSGQCFPGLTGENLTTGMQRWRPGQSGNPNGRPRGSKNKKSLVAEEFELQGSAVAQKVIEAALGGDMQAATLVLQRICPPLRPKAEKTPFDLDAKAPLADQAQQIMGAIAKGEIDIDTGRILIGCLSSLASLKQVDEFEHRIAALEREAI